MTRAVRRVPPFLVALLVLLAAPAHSFAQTTALYVDSQPGDPVGRGLTHTWTQTDLTFGATTNSLGHVTVAASASDHSNYWFLTFSAPGSEVVPGVYENVTRFGSNVSPGLHVFSYNGSCSTVGGRFVVYEFSRDASGAVTSFAADFEQHCHGATPALFGAIRFKSARTSLSPFDGAYPVYALKVDVPVNGYVTGAGIDCGAGRTDCEEVYSSSALVVLQAVPSAGFMFLGWAGDCVGKELGAVFVRWRRFCTPVFNRLPGSAATESPDYSDGALFLDNLVWANDVPLPPGERSWEVFAPLAPDSPIRSTITLSPSINARDRVQFTVDGPRGETYQFLFGAPSGEVLTPGTDYLYTAPTFDRFTRAPVLEFRRNGYFSFDCGSEARFRVHEFAFDEALSSVTAFAADFEVTCGYSQQRYTGSIRYHSTRSSLLPFDGVYPRYALNIVPTIGGVVTSSGIACGDGGQTDCSETYATPSRVELQAVASPGYQFMGWAGSCSVGTAAASLVVDRMKRCSAVFAPTPTSGLPEDDAVRETTYYLQTRDGAGAPADRVWFGGDVQLDAQASPSTLSVRFNSSTTGADANIYISLIGGVLAPGDYEYEYGDVSAFSIWVTNFSCNHRGARFRLYELSVDASGGVESLAADFEVDCGPFDGRVVGAVRINSSRGRLVPFDGAFPFVKLKINPAINGIVTGPGIECGPGRVDCSETFAAPTTVTLQALPAPGYRFVGWSGRCEGGSTTSIALEWIRSCEAVFNSVIPGSNAEDPRLAAASFFIDSQPGDAAGQGRRRVWLESRLIVSAFSLNRIHITIYEPSGVYWTLELQSATQTLQTGNYENATDAYTPGTSHHFSVGSSSSGCPTGSVGRFVIHEIVMSERAVYSLAVDFEQRCTPTAPWLRGSFRFHSSRSVLTPFAPLTFTPVPPPARSDFNRDGWADLVWRHSGSGRNAIWLMNGATPALTTVLAPAVAATLSDLTWEIRAVADINADGNPDLIWQKRDTGRIAVWYMTGATMTGASNLYDAGLNSHETDLDWKIVAAGDMNRDGQVDLLWRHKVSGEIRLWRMLGNTQWDSVTVATVADLGWETVGLADMNGDAMLDLVWRHAFTGKIAAWYMQDTTFQAAARMSPSELTDTNWHIVGVADMNMDQKPDLVWQNFATGGLGIWYMNGVVMTHGSRMTPPSVSDPQWRIVGVK